MRAGRFLHASALAYGCVLLHGHALGAMRRECTGAHAQALCPCSGPCKCAARMWSAACARFKKAAYTLEFLPATGPAAPAAARVRDAEAKLLQKRGSLQGFEAEFQQARVTPDMLAQCSGQQRLRGRVPAKVCLCLRPYCLLPRLRG